PASVRVRWQGGDVAPGVPRSFVEHDLGEAFAYSLATPSASLPSVSVAPQVVGGSHNTVIPGAPGRPAVPGRPGSIGSQGNPPGASMPFGSATHRVSTRPLWLLLLYLAWQTTAAGTVASLGGWRSEPST